MTRKFFLLPETETTPFSDCVGVPDSGGHRALQVGSDYAERKYSPGVWPKVMRNAEINALGLS
jgi:hypothetical protein